MGLIIVEEVVVGAGWRTSCRTSDDFVDWTLCQVPRYVHLRFAWYKQYAVWVYRRQVILTFGSQEVLGPQKVHPCEKWS